MSTRRVVPGPFFRLWVLAHYSYLCILRLILQAFERRCEWLNAAKNDGGR